LWQRTGIQLICLIIRYRGSIHTGCAVFCYCGFDYSNATLTDREGLRTELRANASQAWHQDGLHLGERKLGKEKEKNISVVSNPISWRRQCFLSAAAQRGELCRKRRRAALTSASSWSEAAASACSCSGAGALMFLSPRSNPCWCHAGDSSALNSARSPSRQTYVQFRFWLHNYRMV
jgi:hypothetical protein